MKRPLLWIGGPLLVGVVVAIGGVAVTYEAPCACGGGFVDPVGARVATYRARLAAFDATHAAPTCPASIAVLDAYPPGEHSYFANDVSWYMHSFTLVCRLVGDPRTRVLELHHPGLDGAIATADDRVVTITTP